MPPDGFLYLFLLNFAEVIAASEVGAAMRRLGQPINDDDEVLQMTIQTVDPEGTGKIGACVPSMCLSWISLG